VFEDVSSKPPTPQEGDCSKNSVLWKTICSTKTKPKECARRGEEIREEDGVRLGHVVEKWKEKGSTCYYLEKKPSCSSSFGF
jgi:hypothetical protein